MINYLWAFMILVGIAYAAISGNLSDVTLSIISESKAAINLGITLFGIISMWTGVMKIAEKVGLIDSLTRKLSPVLTFLFPRLNKNSLARKYIATNLIANVLGLSYAATPPGLKAMKELQKINKDKEVASTEMITFLIINISSVQLISMNMIAYRTEYGSANPAEIIGPSLFATAISTIVGVIFVKIMMKVSKQ